MGKLVVGDFLPDFAYDTPFEKGRSISEAVEKKTKTVLLFLRYYGCTMCQLDIHELASNYDKIVAKGAQALVVLQSDSENLATQLQKKDALPFDIICDPEQRLYKKFEITPAVSMKKMMDAKSVIKAVKATTKGYKHGEYEGEELQLPATFIVDKDMKITYAHYGKSLADIPNVVKLEELL